MLVLFTLLTISNSFVVNAITTQNETETNDEYTTADRTYDDYNNYGYISSQTDVDWWVISFNYDGIVNFYLGSIPAYKDYDMYLYKNNGTTLIAASTSSGNELIRCRVYSGVNYRIKISLNSGYSSSQAYMFRAKNYALQNAKLFTFNTTNDYRPTATFSTPHLWSMGYTVVEYLNNSASAAYGALPTSDICVYRHHSSEGAFRFDQSDGTQTYIYANRQLSSNSPNRSLSALSASALSYVDLVMFIGCESGLGDSSNNLVDVAISKGVHSAVGWKQIIYTDTMNYWTGEFFKACATGMSVGDAMEAADEAVGRHSEYSRYADSAEDRYVGSSQIYKLIIGATK